MGVMAACVFFLIRMRGARPCVATDAATIEGTISVRCNRRRYDCRYYFGVTREHGVHGGVCLVLATDQQRSKVLFQCVVFDVATIEGPISVRFD